METFEKIITAINDVVWSNWLVYLCLATGIFFSVRMRFPQFRLFKDMVRLIKAKPDTDKGITPFQSFAATVGSRVGRETSPALPRPFTLVARGPSSGCGPSPSLAQPRPSVKPLWPRRTSG